MSHHAPLTPAGFVLLLVLWPSPSFVAVASEKDGTLHSVRPVPLDGDSPPLSFTPSFDHLGAATGFRARGSGLDILFTRSEFVVVVAQPMSGARCSGRSARGARDTAAVRLSVPHATLRFAHLGANPRVEIAGFDEQPTRVNTFRGADPGEWERSVPTYARVVYRTLYSGIDLVVHGASGAIEWDYEVAPGTNPGSIVFSLSGADSVEIDPGGDLVAYLAGAAVRQQRPVIYQNLNGTRRQISGGYARRPDGSFSFAVGEYDHSLPLTIDPVLSCAAFLGGSDSDWGNDIAVDQNGNIIVVGGTYSVDFPTTLPLGGATGDESDAFVAKFTPDGVPVFVTYLGGSEDDEAWGVATDHAGNIYVAGQTWSEDFPTRNALQPANAFPGDGFVAKLDPNGSQLDYSTYLGGFMWDSVKGIAVDATGKAFVTGWTDSPDFPTKDPLQATLGDIMSEDCFLAVLAPDGGSLLFSTFLGGTDYDGGERIVLDGAANVYVVGTTTSSDFPVASPLQSTNAGYADAFVAKVRTDPPALLFSTYLGGSDDDEGWDIAVDGSSSVFVAGDTASSNFPIRSPSQGSNAGDWDAFVAKLDPAGSSLAFATYLGGESADNAYGLALAGDKVCVAGATSSLAFPLASPLQGTYRGDDSDLFFTVFSASGARLTSTYLGGVNTEEAYAVATDATGSAYLAGFTDSTDFPARNAAYPSFRGLADSFWLRLDGAAETCALSCEANVAAAARAGSPASFSATATVTGCAGAPTFEWTFGDGSPPSGSQTTTHSYGAAGMFNWRLVVRAGGLTCARAGSIPVATAASVAPGKFIGQTSQGLPIEIEFGAGGQTAGRTVDLACATDVGRMLWVSACNAAGNAFTCGSVQPCFDSSQLVGAFTSPNAAAGTLLASVMLTGSGECCVLNLTWSAQREGTACTLECAAAAPATAQVGEAVKFGATTTATGCDGAVGYEWEFGDGSPLDALQNPTHVFVAPGVYTWKLTARVGTQTCVKSGSITVNARIRRHLKAGAP